MLRKINIRIILDILIILSISIFPWWLTAFFVIVGLFFFDNFYEAFLFAIINDSVYGISRELFFGVHFVSFLFVTISFFLIHEFKKRLRF